MNECVIYETLIQMYKWVQLQEAKYKLELDSPGGEAVYAVSEAQLLAFRRVEAEMNILFLGLVTFDE